MISRGIRKNYPLFNTPLLNLQQNKSMKPSRHHRSSVIIGSAAVICASLVWLALRPSSPVSPAEVTPFALSRPSLELAPRPVLEAPAAAEAAVIPMEAPAASARNSGITREVAKVPDMARLDAFDAWSKRWEQADAAGRAALAAEGPGLAAARRPEFKALIASNPRLALERSVPRVVRQDLPEEIATQLEQSISAKGEYRVMHVCGHSADEHQAAHPCDTIRSFVVGEVIYKANVEAALEGLMSRKTAPLQGVAIDDEMAISANAVRRLGAGERIPAGTVVEQLDPVSLATTADVSEGEVITVGKPMVEIAGQLYAVSSPAQADVLERDFGNWAENEYSNSTVPSFFATNFPNPSAKRIGNFRILYVRLAWPDRPVTHTEESVIATMREAERLLNSWSYGKLVTTTTITPIVTMPWPFETVPGTEQSIFTENAVRSLGYDPDEYDVMVMQAEGLGGVAWSGRYIATGGGSLGTIIHEGGHELGLNHSGFWNAIDGTGYGFQTDAAEYGNFIDPMGGGNGTVLGLDKSPYGTVGKVLLGWLTPQDIHQPKTNGVYRLHAFDQPVLEEGKRYALVIKKDSFREYYLEYRPSVGGLLTDSALVLYKGASGTNNGYLVDTTPYTPIPENSYDPTTDMSKLNSGIALGRTFSDLEADIHLTVIAKNATVPPSLDIVYNRGPFPGNQAPALAAITPSATTIAVGGSITFDASAATDADGDTLAYYWDFDDGLSAPNSAVVTRTFTSAAQITAMVTVSDMKGGTVRRHVVVNVGTHGRQTVTGNITLAGQPVENVRVMISGGKYAFTDRSGNYALSGVSTGNRTLTTWFNGYALTPSFTNPLNVIAGSNTANWTAAASSTFVTLTKIADASEGGANGIFRITRTGSTAAPLVVRTSETGGSAAFTNDYTLSPDRMIDSTVPKSNMIYWTFTIPAGQASLDVSVAAVSDTDKEGPKTVTFQLGLNGTYLLSSASYAIMTLNDDDTTLPQVAVTSNDPYASEFPADPGSFTFTRTGSTADSLNLSVGWSGSAANGIDFTSLPSVVTIPAGQSSITLSVSPVNDSTSEATETVIATVQASAAAYVIAGDGTSASVDITDDDLPVVTVSVTDASASEVGPDSGVFLIHRSGSTTAPLKVHYGAQGTALHGTDYVPLSGEVTIPAGASNAPVLITPYEDAHSEPLETVILNIATVTNTYRVGAPSQGLLNISSDTDLPLISVRNGVVGAEGGANAAVIFRAVGTGTGNVTVNYTVSGTATSGTDFTPLTGSVSIPINGINDVTVSIPILNDTLAEATESVVVTLAPDSAYLIANDASAETFIRDNDSGDQRVNVNIGEVLSQNENFIYNPANTNAPRGAFYFSRTNNTSDLVVNYAVSGTATNGIDYVNLPGTVTIPAGADGVFVDIVLIDDNLPDGLETVSLSVLPGFGYSPEAIGGASLQIIDNEVLPTTVGFFLTSSLTSEAPGATGEFREIEVRLSAASTSPVTVQVRVGSGTTAIGSDVDWSFVDAGNNNANVPFGTLTFGPGITSRNLRVRVKNDGIQETTETAFLELYNATGASLTTDRSIHSLFISNETAPSLVTEERWNTTAVYNSNTWNSVAPGYTGRLVDFTPTRNVGSNFSRRLTGLITAPVTGAYTFWIAADDAAKLFVSTDATSANKGTPRASLSSYTSFQNWTANTSQQSAPITLTAGQSYYVEVQHLETGGGDHVSVAWEGPGFNRSPLDITAPNTPPDNAPRFVRFAADATTRLESDGSEPLLMAVLDRPAGTTAVTVNYTASGTATAGSDYSLVPGTLTFNPGEQMKAVPLAILSDAIGEAPEVIVVSLSNPSGASLSSPTSHAITLLDVELPVVGTLFTTADSTMGVGTALGTVVATPAPGRSISGWAIVAGNTGNAFAISGAGQLTLATPAALPIPGGMQLIVRATDNTGSTGDGVVNVICTLTANGVIEQRWAGSSAFSNNDWSGATNYNGTLATFTPPRNVADDYSRRLIGYLKPTVSGDYTFWIAGDDDCRLYLSSNDSPSNKTQVAAVSGYTNYQSWDSQPGQKSAVMPLVAGKLYWLEVQHLGGSSGADHVSVAWQRTGSVREAIPAAVIFPYVAGVNFDNPPQPPSIALTSPNAGAAYETGDNVTLSANVAGGSIAVTSVEFYRGSTLIGSDASAPYSVTWTNAIAGNHVLTARAVYSGGGVTSSATTVSVTDLDPAGDRDGDGFTNGLEFALGTDPKSAASQPSAIHANLRAWWKFDETSGTVADDATGRPQDGVVTGATWTAGITGNALSLNGVDNGVLMTSAPSITGSGDFTVSAWVKLAPGSSGGTIIQQREPGVGGNLGQYALNANSNGTVSFSVYGTSGDQFNLTTTGTINDGAWHLVAGTRQGVTGTILVDGFSAASGSSSSTLMPLATHAVSVGYDHRDNNKRFNGLIDDVRIHERALSAAELKSARDSLVPNSAPVFTASSLTAIATEDTVFSGQLAATDVDYGDTRTFSKIDGPGWLSIAANGGLSGTPGNSDVGSRAFTVRVTDASGLSTDATLAVSVINVNDAPVAVNDGSSGSPFVTLAEDGTAAAISVLANDSDIDGDPLTVTAASSPNGSVVINSGTTLSFSPTANFNGATTISYTISDGQGGTASATVSVSVTAVNDAPTITDVANQSTNEDIATSAIPFTIGDVDTALASLTVTRTSSNTSLVPLANVVLGGSGTNRTVTLTPAPDQSGTSTITLTVSDGTLTATDTFVLTVNAVNDAPTLTLIVNQSTSEDTVTAAIPFIIGDIDTAVGSLIVNRSSSNTTLVPVANVVLGDSGTSRTVTITPAANQYGSSTITLAVSDGLLTTTNTFVLTVTPVNDSPLAVSDGSVGSPFVTVAEDSTTPAIMVLANDNDVDGDPLTITAASSADGSVMINTGTTLSFTPTANFNGATTIAYTISDGQGVTASATVFVSVSPVNDAPTITDVVNQSTNEDVATSAIAFTIGDIETAATTLTVTRTSSDTTLLPLANVVLGGSGANRMVTITPAPNQFGTSIVTLTVSDGVLTATDTFVLTVTPVNDLPTITLVSDQSINEDTATSAIAFTIGDIDTDVGSLIVNRSSSNTTLVPLANVVLGGSGTSRSVTITPAANQNGSSTITLAVSDGLLTTTNTFVLTVDPVNDPPLAVNDGSVGTPFVTLAEDSVSSAIAVLANDTDVDLNPLTVTVASSWNGAVVINSGGTLTFTPVDNFNGATTISYTISDGQGGTASATVSVSVTPVNDAPLKDDGALADFQIAKRDAISGEAYTGNFADVASDPDGDGLTFTKTSGPAWLVVDASGALSGTPAVSDEVGSTTVVVRATDPGGLWVEADFQLTVIVRRSLAVNFSNSTIASTAVLATENTNALKTAVAVNGPIVWNNQAIDDAGNGPLVTGRGNGVYSGVTATSFSSVPWIRGSSSVSSSDASQRAFRYYLDDGDGGGGYFNGDSIGASIHLSGLAQFLTTNRATNYTLTLLFNADIAGASPFHPATVRSGIPSTPSSTAISSLPFIGTINPTLLGDGRQPLPTVGTDTGGQRGWGRLIGLTANDITISLPVSGGGKRGSVSGFILTPMNGPLALTPQGNGYVQWRDARFGGSSGNPLIAGETADPNGDGVSNLLAYSMGIDPLSPPAPTATSAQRGRLELVPANGGFSIDYQRDTRATDTILVLEQSATLGASGAWLPAVVTETILSDVGGIRTIRATFTPAPGDMRRFFRLRSSR